MILSYSRTFKKDYKKLSKKLQLQLGARLEIFKTDQFNALLNNHPIHHPYEGCRSINITGDVRAIYEPGEDAALFIRIGTHSELYK